MTPPRLHQPAITPISDRYYRLVDSYEYAWTFEDKRRRIVVPKGSVNDGASVPWFLWTLSRLRPDGLVRAAALIHDWIYRHTGKLPPESCQEETSPGVWTDIETPWVRRDTDRLFSRMLREAGVHKLKRRMAFRAVHWFGSLSWESVRQRSVATLAGPADERAPVDPIFNVEVPLVFAHRGGAEEAPESTRLAFAHAANVGCEVLELDVQLTADDQIVVWHGPELDRVLVTGIPSQKEERKRLKKRYTWQFTWEELNGRTRVLNPGVKLESVSDDGERPPDRQLMLLSDFLDYVRQFDKRDRKIALNIEPKMDQKRIPGRRAFLEETSMVRFVDILDRKADGRHIVVASPSGKLLKYFRRMSENRWPTSLSLREQLFYRPLRSFISVKGRAFQTSYAIFTLPVFRWYFRPVIRAVQSQGGAVHVFLTPFWPFPRALKRSMTQGEIDMAILAILDIGIDGIMTDYPRRVTESVRWILGRDKEIE